MTIDENTFLSGKFESNGNYEIKLESSFVNFKDIYATNLNVDFNNKSGFIELEEINSKLISGKDFKLFTEFIDDSLKVKSSYKSLKR